MNRTLIRLFYVLIGSPARSSLEHRLFNTISLINGVANLSGAFSNLFINNSYFLFALNFITGLLFCLFYFLSRVHNIYHILYWPFILLIVGFLFINILGNSGSTGGAHYYFIPSLVIAVILSRSAKTTLLAFLLNGIATAAIFIIETYYPGWIVPYRNNAERIFDVAGQYFFVQIFTGGLVLILARNFYNERDKSEKLLKNILPETIAEELKHDNKVKPLHYESVTVLFTDFSEFTKIAERMDPEALVAELDACFTLFDEIIKRFRLEKIKTIGDSYMSAGGIPDPRPGHAVNTVLAALEIRNEMERLKEKRSREGQPFWTLRIGIHTGPLVAGVIGQNKFAYDVWGDTVNVASRMESSGIPGQINISGATYELIKDFFTCDYRGKVAAKNKGEVDMYFIKGIRRDLSVDYRGEAPDRRFFEQFEKRFIEESPVS